MADKGAWGIVFSKATYIVIVSRVRVYVTADTAHNKLFFVWKIML